MINFQCSNRCWCSERQVRLDSRQLSVALRHIPPQLEDVPHVKPQNLVHLAYKSFHWISHLFSASSRGSAPSQHDPPRERQALSLFDCSPSIVFLHDPYVGEYIKQFFHNSLSNLRTIFQVAHPNKLRNRKEGCLALKPKATAQVINLQHLLVTILWFVSRILGTSITSFTPTYDLARRH
jgi:hypothetical protein